MERRSREREPEREIDGEGNVGEESQERAVKYLLPCLSESTGSKVEELGRG